uniref:GHMP kinase N-terminal domain-containing protein n=1 Tax=Haptolina brevifila TaxID=156173 RepID=A0A7S2JE82_9EUKA
MGGIADYSGSLVLQMPISEATIVALQIHPSAPNGTVRAVSLFGSSSGRTPAFEMPLADLFGGANGAPTALSDLRNRFAAQDDSQWAAYVIGVIGVLAHEPETRGALAASGGLSILISSSVPEGKGVSSSAAVEVGTMMATLGALGVEFSPPERVALLCQRAENFVVGAPCGVMDQMASALGSEAMLLPLLCQPATLRDPVPIPPHLRFWGIDSGVRHSVGGSDYGTVRAATFMARTLLRKVLRDRNAAAAASPASALPAVPEPAASVEHLVTISPSLLAELAPFLPHAIKGSDFLKQHGSHGDAATTIEPNVTYNLASCAAHPVHEHFRVGCFEALLRAPPSDGQLVALGEMMYQSHASYSGIGLGSGATDLLVQLVRALGPASGLYGAKITGGGSGGTVCVLGAATAQAEASFQKLLAAYKARSGHSPYVVSGSSNGAVAFGHVEVNLQAGSVQLFNRKSKGRKLAAPSTAAVALLVLGVAVAALMRHHHV